MFFLDAYIYIKENNLKKDTKTMKNILAENLLRFGVKNLKESDKEKIVESFINEVDDTDTASNGWFRLVQNNSSGNYFSITIYPTLPFLSYVSGGQAKINQGYYDIWVKNGANEAAAQKLGLDILGIYKPAIDFMNIPLNSIKTKDCNGLHAAIMALLNAKQTSIVNYAPIGTGCPSGQDANAIKLLSAKSSTYKYYNYKTKQYVNGGVPTTDTTYTGPGKGSLYQLALEAAVAKMTV
jgi:hypothetical protein